MAEATEPDWAVLDAVAHDDADALRLLLGRVDPGPWGGDLLGRVAALGHTRALRVLLEDERFDPSHDRTWAVGAAAPEGHVEAVCMLLADERVDPRDRNEAALRAAAWHGHFAVVVALLTWCRNPGHRGRAGACGPGCDRVDPAVDGKWALAAAVRNGHAHVASVLVADPRVGSPAKNNDWVMVDDFSGM